MNAISHASMCVDYAAELERELEITPVLSNAVTYGDDERKQVYCHPDDINKRNVRDFKYPHREI